MRLADIEQQNAVALAERARIAAQTKRAPLDLAALNRLPTFTGLFEFAPAGVDPMLLMLCDRDDGVALRCFWNGAYERATFAVFAALAASAQGVVDAGAHTGIYSLAAAALAADRTVLAFEPNPQNFGRLLTHRRLNGRHNIQPFALALSNDDGQAWLEVRAPLGYHSTGGAIGAPKTSGFAIRTVMLDQVVRQIGVTVDLIKCDVEGHELNVLEGAAATIASQRPDIILECLGGADDQATGAFLSSRGYRFLVIDEAASALRPVAGFAPERDGNGTALETRRNRLATQKTDAELDELRRGMARYLG